MHKYTRNFRLIRCAHRGQDLEKVDHKMFTAFVLHGTSYKNAQGLVV